jgi:hypothetical protein
MAEQKPKAASKFAGIFQQAAPAETENEQERREITPPPAARPLGRPPGKRSDPAWKQFSVLLKRETQREAASILRAKDEGLDLSGLVQNLLEGWIKKQKS